MVQPTPETSASPDDLSLSGSMVTLPGVERRFDARGPLALSASLASSITCPPRSSTPSPQGTWTPVGPSSVKSRLFSLASLGSEEATSEDEASEMPSSVHGTSRAQLGIVAPSSSQVPQPSSFRPAPGSGADEAGEVLELDTLPNMGSSVNCDRQRARE